MKVRPCAMGAVALVAATFAFLLSGCTVLGLGAGAAVDQFRPTRFDPRPPDLVTGVSLKTPVVIAMRDSTEIVGRYMGVLPVETADSTMSPGSGTDAGTWKLAILRSDGSLMQVAADSIASLAVAAPKRGKLWGALIGLAIDLTVVIYVFFFGFSNMD